MHGEQHDILVRRILPEFVQGRSAQRRPVVVFVAGQPGSGKTRLAGLLCAVLEQRGGAVRVGRDWYKCHHPAYAAYLAEDVRTAGARVRPATRGWQAAVEECVRAHRLDAVVETALADVDEFRRDALAYGQAGARRELVVLAVPEAVSQLGVLERFVAGAVEGGGRYVSWANHDACAAGLLPAVEIVDAERLVERVTVLRRDGAVLYANELGPDGAWLRPPATREAVVRERARPWSARETAEVNRRVAVCDRRLHCELRGEDERLAVQRDSERVAALAEPVRRMGQATAGPPGVDYHRLSAAEHRWIFEELIVPGYLSGIVPRPDPRAVYVLGQPGAGKTAAARMVKRALRPGTTHLTGDAFKSAHPDYRALLLENPRGAGAAVRTDYRAWAARAEERVREQRGDVLIEAAPGSPEALMGSVLPFVQDGYPVELVVLAVREADSRLAAALRYARALQAGLPARLTSRAGHDVCYRGLADALEHALGAGAVAAVTVVRRGGDALLRVEQPGPRAGHRAVWALAAERQRPYTRQEAGRFLMLHQALRRALPQHREELDQIAGLARPLMPLHAQPDRLECPRSSRWPPPLLYDSFSSLARAA
ncbi:zeta toxin family protein [Streptomyces cacaoi]|uniref:zeta toxin family protein n=1 Tax=Streptomyces cacaoi TaxID=1898 RepID=UPI00262347B7|nr:zeta toxin family protein [Streptomyces cacaoi]